MKRVPGSGIQFESGQLPYKMFNLVLKSGVQAWVLDLDFFIQGAVPGSRLRAFFGI